MKNTFNIVLLIRFINLIYGEAKLEIDQPNIFLYSVRNTPNKCLSFPEDYQVTDFFTNSDDQCTQSHVQAASLTHLHSSNYQSHFSNTLASPMFTCSVFLLFNFKRFLPCLWRDLSRFRRCQFVLLQTP